MLVTSSPERSISIITAITLDGAGKKRVSMKSKTRREFPHQQQRDRRGDAQDALARAHATGTSFAPRLRRRRFACSSTTTSLFSCSRARCTSSRRPDQMRCTSSPNSGAFCSSMMLRGRASGTCTKLFTRPGCAVITMMRSPRKHRLVDAVGDEHDGLLLLVPDAQQLLLQQQLVLRVERRERLVHQQDFRIVGEGARDGDALLHAAGELVRIIIGEARQPGARRDNGRPAP